MARSNSVRTMARVLVYSAFWTTCSAATITVDLSGGADFTDIQSAIDAAKDGDSVLVKAGEYVIAEPLDFNRLYDPQDPASSESEMPRISAGRSRYQPSHTNAHTMPARPKRKNDARHPYRA